MLLAEFLPWTWMTLCRDLTALSQGFCSRVDWHRGSTCGWDNEAGPSELRAPMTQQHVSVVLVQQVLNKKLGRTAMGSSHQTLVMCVWPLMWSLLPLTVSVQQVLKYCEQPSRHQQQHCIQHSGLNFSPVSATSGCLNAPSCCHVISKLDIYIIEQMEKTPAHTDTHTCTCIHLTSIPSKALTQASEASQMASRSCPPSRARTTRPPASDISCRVKKPKPGEGTKQHAHMHVSTHTYTHTQVSER